MVDLGSGIRLDSDFDLDVDRTGDVGASEQLDELQKDLSLAVVEILTTGSTEKLPDVYDQMQIPDSIRAEFNPDTGKKVEDGGVIGEFYTDGFIRDIEVLVANIISIDPRIRAVTRVEAQRDLSGPNELEVDARARIAELGSEESFEFVISPS